MPNGTERALAEVRKHSGVALAEVRKHSGVALAEVRKHSGVALAEVRKHSGVSLAEERKHSGLALAEVRKHSGVARNHPESQVDASPDGLLPTPSKSRYGTVIEDVVFWAAKFPL